MCVCVSSACVCATAVITYNSLDLSCAFTVYTPYITYNTYKDQETHSYFHFTARLFQIELKKTVNMTNLNFLLATVTKVTWSAGATRINVYTGAFFMTLLYMLMLTYV